MDAKLKAKWLRALRSKKYRQARGELKHRGAFCCLGVLADIQGAKWVNGCPIINGIDDPMQTRMDLVPKFAGGLRKKTQDTLADMNDSGQPFSEIADYIGRRIK